MTNNNIASLHNVVTLTVNLANGNTMTRTAGEARGMRVAGQRWLVGFTLAFKCTTNRDEGQAVFRLSIPNGDLLTIDEPYQFISKFADETVYRLTAYMSTDRTYFANPAAWHANFEFRVTGMGYMYVQQ